MDLVLRIIVGVIIGLLVAWLAAFIVPAGIANLLGILAAVLVIWQGPTWYDRVNR
jgi:hypothetical protein